MSFKGQLLRSLPQPPSPARQDLERNLLDLLRKQSVAPENAVSDARKRLPIIVPLISPRPTVVAAISPEIWPHLEQLHRQAGTGVRELQQGLRQPAARRAAPAPRPAPPARPAPRPASKPSWLRSGWVWYFLVGVVLPVGWIGGALWSTHRSQATLRDAAGRLERLHAETAAQHAAARHLESRLQAVRSQAEGNLTTQRDALENEVARLRDTLNRWESNVGIPALSGLPAGFATPLELVRIEPGTFLMGSPANERDRSGSEEPQTRVAITKAFSIGKYEVTQGQFQAVVGNNPSHFKGSTNLPVESVSWVDATNFCAKLTAQERQAARIPANWVYRLPTEAEWEYACRAGTTTRFSFGDDPQYSELGNYAWYSGNSGNQTHPVGGKQPKAWGLYDMHGNVWEWCQDWYGTYLGGTVTNPVGPSSGSDRVLRGGSWVYDGRGCRSAYRNSRTPDYRNFYIGFRVVLAPGQP